MAMILATFSSAAMSSMGFSLIWPLFVHVFTVFSVLYYVLYHTHSAITSMVSNISG